MASWISNSLKKVESLLETVDQTAATTLKRDDAFDNDSSQSKSLSQSAPANPYSFGGQKGQLAGKSSSKAPAAPARTLNDEDIFKFLNDDPVQQPPPVAMISKTTTRPKKSVTKAPKKPPVAEPVVEQPKPLPSEQSKSTVDPPISLKQAPEPQKPSSSQAQSLVPKTPASNDSKSSNVIPEQAPPSSINPTQTYTDPTPAITLSPAPATSTVTPSETITLVNADVDSLGDSQASDKDAFEPPRSVDPRNIALPPSPITPYKPPPSTFQEDLSAQDSDLEAISPRGESDPEQQKDRPVSNTEQNQVLTLNDLTLAPVLEAPEITLNSVAQSSDLAPSVQEAVRTDSALLPAQSTNTEAPVSPKTSAPLENVEIEEPEEEEEEEIDERDEIIEKYNALALENSKTVRENKLMRTEVVKLHEELVLLTNKTRSTAEALSQATDVLSEHQKMAIEKEKQLLRMLQQEKDLETALEAKDMQLGGMRAQIEGFEKTVKARDSTISSFQDKIDKLTHERDSLLEGNQRTSLQNRERLDENERFFNEERLKHQETKRLALERENELQTSVAESTKALASAQRSLDEKSIELQRIVSQHKELNSEYNKQRQELHDYKLRATKVLQSNQQKIAELNERVSLSSSGGDTQGATSAVNVAELLRLQQERDALIEERDDLSLTVDQLRGSLQDVQAQAEAEVDVLRSHLSSSEDALEKERKRVQVMQLELLTRATESAASRDESDKTAVELREMVASKDAELAKLKRQITSKANNSSSQTELENRLRVMTDHLIQKQTQIDTLLSEKSFLHFQLENAQKEPQKGGASGADHRTILMPKVLEDPDDFDGHSGAKPRHVRSIASLVPARENAVTKRVVGAANSMDSLSFSFARYLRRSPGARLAALLYVAMIHLMGFYIMATWNPESHLGEPHAH